MNLGLKHGTVKLLSHQDMWYKTAKDTISLISDLLGDIAVNIEHVGSTAIRGISAKPIIDIAIGVNKIEDIVPYIQLLEQNGIVFRGEEVSNQYLFVIGDFEKDIRSHHIHIVEHNSDAWRNYINFRDYLNSFPEKAEEYDLLKQKLAQFYPDDRIAYTNGKRELINQILNLTNDLYHKETI